MRDALKARAGLAPYARMFKLARGLAEQTALSAPLLQRMLHGRLIAKGRDGRWEACALDCYLALLVLGERAFDFSADGRGVSFFGEALFRAHAEGGQYGFAPPLIDEYFRALRRQLALAVPSVSLDGTFSPEGEAAARWQAQLDGAVTLWEIFLCAQLRSSDASTRRIYRGYLGEIYLDPGYEQFKRAADDLGRLLLVGEIVREVGELRGAVGRIAGEEYINRVVDLEFATGVMADRALFYDYAAGASEGEIDLWVRFHRSLVDLVELLAEAAEQSAEGLREEIATFFEGAELADDSVAAVDDERATRWFFRDWLSLAPTDGDSVKRVMGAAKRIFARDVSIRFDYELLLGVLDYLGVVQQAGGLDEATLKEAEELADEWGALAGAVFPAEVERVWTAYLALKEGG